MMTSFSHDMLGFILVSTVLQSISFQYVKELVGFPMSVENSLSSYIGTIQDMKDRQNTKISETSKLPCEFTAAKRGVLSLAGLSWEWNFNPHSHRISVGIPIGFPKGFP